MICHNCGNNVPDGTKFCSVCGTGLQAPVNQTPVEQQPPVGYQPPMGQQPPVGYQPPVGQQPPVGYQPPVGQQPPIGYQSPMGQQSNVIISQESAQPPVKKKKTGLIVGIVIAVVVALLVIGGIIVGVVFSVLSKEAAPVERGVIDGNLYINESLNIEFEKPNTWTFYSDDELAEIIGSGSEIFDYSDFEQALIEQNCIYAMGAKNIYGTNVLLMIEDVSIYDHDESDYIDIVKDQLNSQSYIEYEFTSEKEVYLAGETYVSADFEAEYYSTTIYQRYYLRRHGDYMIGIIASSSSLSDLNEIEYMFSSVN